MSLLSSWYDMNVCIKFLEDDVCAGQYDKTGYLSFEVNSSDQLYLKERPISLPLI